MKLIYIPSLTVFLAFIMISTSLAQINFPPVFEPGDDPLKNVAHSNNSEYWIRSGAFMGTGSGGAELMIRSKKKSVFGSFHAGMMGNPEKRIPDARQMRFGGLTIGVEKPLYVSNNGSQLNVDSGVLQSGHAGMRLYYRLGAGVNFSVVERINLATGEQSSKLHPGVQTMGMVGVSSPVSKKFSLFMEMGGMLSWNQSLPQMRWWGQPYLSVGVSTAGFW